MLNKKSNKKKILTGLLTAALAFNIFITFSAAEFIDIYEERTSENISKGVVHENIMRFTNEGWLNINVMRIDLEDKYTSLEVLTHEDGISNRDSLTNLASKNELANEIIGAINGDFYDTNAFATVGPIVKDGNLLTSSKNHPDFATFNIDSDNNPFIDYWSKNTLNISNTRNNAIINIGHKNKSYIDNSVILLDKNWGNLSFGIEKHENIVEMIILENRVVEIRNNLEAIEIPEDGFVIAATGPSKEYILNNFSVNDIVLLNTSTQPDFEKLSLAIGGGAVILKDGNIPNEFSLKIPRRHPRTSIGISKDREEIILVTIDGRTSSYTGVTQRELAEILLELGAHDGINLDGGGSTEMVVKPLGENDINIANNPSGGFERRIMNGLAVLNNSPKSSLKDIIIQCEDKNIFLESSRVFELKGYDKNYNPIEIDLEDAKWTVEGIEGEFDDNKFFPKTTGNGTIKTSYKGKTASMDIKVISNPIDLSISPSKIFAQEKKEVPLYAEAVNDEGYRAKVELDDLNWSIPGNIGKIQDNAFIASDKVSADIIKASLNGINSYIQVSTGYRKVQLENFEGKNGSFLPYPNEATGNYDISSKEKEGNSSGKLSYDFSNIIGTKAAYIVFNNGGLYMAEKPEKLGLWVYGDKGNSHWLRGQLKDSAGSSFNINFARNVDWEGWRFVEAPIPNNAVAPLNLERLYLVETQPTFEDSGYIYVDDMTAFYKSKLDKEIPKDNTIFTDKRNIPSELNNENSFRFLAHGNISDMDTLLDKLVIRDLSTISNAMDLNVFTNHIDKEFEDKLSDNYIVGASGPSLLTHNNSSFIRLDNSNNGIRATDYKQWTWLLDTLRNIKSDSLFVILPNPLNFNDKLEEKLFLDTFKSLKEEKNMDIWILTGGNNDNFDIKIIDGIRFVKLKSYPQNNNIDVFDQLKYMVFTVNDGYVTYEIKDMYEKNN